MRKAGQTAKFLKDCTALSLLDLMKNSDYESISISDICTHAGIGRTTFYRHFGRTNPKDDVLIYYAFSLWADYCKKHAELVSRDLWGALMSYLYDSKDFYTAIGHARLHAVLFAIFDRSIGPSGEEAPETAYFKSALAGAVFGITYHWIRSGFRTSPFDLAARIAELTSKDRTKTEAAV